MGPNSGMMGPYGSYKSEGDWSASAKDFLLRLVCPTENIGGVIGKGGVIIKQIRQESGASIKVDSSAAEGDDCLIVISAKEVNFVILIRVLNGFHDMYFYRLLKNRHQQLMRHCGCNHDAAKKPKGILVILYSLLVC